MNRNKLEEIEKRLYDLQVDLQTYIPNLGKNVVFQNDAIKHLNLARENIILLSKFVPIK